MLGLPDGTRACLFDLDGVLTQTAKVHAAAWKEMFDGFLRDRSGRLGETFLPFDAERDYDEHVDGRPRADGVRTFLASRGLELPEGGTDDPPEAEMTLHPGDCLYVPRGHLHAAQSRDDVSIHLTVGILAFTWVDAFKRALAGTEDEPSFREALAPGYADAPTAELEGEVRARVGQLRDWLDGLDPAELARDLKRRFHAGRPPLLHGHLDQLVRLETIDDGTVVRRRPYTSCRLEVGDLCLDVVLGDRVVRMPSRLAPVLERLVETPAVTVRELDPWLDRDGRLLLVRRLVREGLLEQVER